MAAIQPSSSAPSNVMYNAPGNSQPNLNQMPRSVSGPSSGLGCNGESDVAVEFYG
jgi:SWI/SNF related-matrix-associated actin-dependent regulator of chromatin subfamily C